MPRKTVLIVDDDVHIGDMLSEALSHEGYSVARAYSGTEAVLAIESGSRPDLVLLDLMLPGLSGEEVLPKLADFPVIVLSAKADPSSKVSLLLGGAEDYVTKPFELSELLARIAVRLRGERFREGGVLVCDDLRLDTARRTVTAAGAEVKLTRTEYAILKLLMQKPSQVYTKSQLLDRISADTPDCTDSSLKIHISNLRRKLREPTSRDCIEAVWGIGFRMRKKDV